MRAATTASAAKQDLIAPNFASNRPPRFPERAKLKRWEGTVILKVDVDDAGRVTNVEVLRSSGYSILDAAAVNSVRSWRGTPAKRYGRPTPSTWNIPIQFKL